MSAPDPRARRLAELLADRYELLAFLGHGGFAAVYKVRSKSLDRLEALKVLLASHEDDPEFASRFRQEARLAASLDHPNIVRIFDFGTTQELFWYSMQFVDGPTLTKELQTGPMDERRAATLLVPLCDALAYAHGRGIVHRDIKPDNIMLGPTGRPVVMDFGIAKAENSMVKTQTGLILGSPAYLSPEQVRGEQLDGRSDIYSLGITLYQMVSGKRPFTAEDRTLLMIKRLREDPVPLDRARAGLDPRLVALVMRCLSRDRAQRPTAAEMRDELQEMRDAWRARQVPPPRAEPAPPRENPTAPSTLMLTEAVSSTATTEETAAVQATARMDPPVLLPGPPAIPPPPHVSAPPPPLPPSASPHPPAIPGRRRSRTPIIVAVSVLTLAAAAVLLRPAFRRSSAVPGPHLAPEPNAPPSPAPSPLPSPTPAPTAVPTPTAAPEPTPVPTRPPLPTPVRAARAERRPTPRMPREPAAEQAPALPGRAAVVRPEVVEQAPVNLPSELAGEYAGRSTGLKVTIGADGAVKNVKVSIPVSPPCAACDQAAADSVKRSRFSPARDRDGKPVESTFGVAITF